MAVFCITGIAGFIGSHTADVLHELGHCITGIDDLSTGRYDNIRLASDVVISTILDKPALRKAMQGAEYVIHLAARASVPRSLEDPIATNIVNVDGTLRVLEMARECNVRRVVVASSSSVYGNTAALPKSEDMRCHPRSPYAVSKLTTETYAAAWWHSFGLQTVAMRYFNVYGPRQRSDTGYAAVVPAFISAALSNKPATIYGDGEQTRDFTFVRDVAAANVAACFAPAALGRVFNICGGYETSLLQLHALIAKLAGNELTPYMHDARSGDVRRSIGSAVNARNFLDWGVKTDIKSGLQITYEAMKKAVDEPKIIL